MGENWKPRAGTLQPGSSWGPESGPLVYWVRFGMEGGARHKKITQGAGPVEQQGALSVGGRADGE